MQQYFNPRSPHGERPRARSLSREYVLFQSTPPAWGATMTIAGIASNKLFQSTPPAWGATLTPACLSSPITISIHAPRVGSDKNRNPTNRKKRYFNPRSPHGERRGHLCKNSVLSNISIHAPRMGSDLRPRLLRNMDSHFNPRSPHGERRFVFSRVASMVTFQSTLPHGERLKSSARVAYRP